jgi:4a-hydroxytetrahydrobiopterin dehydratase
MAELLTDAEIRESIPQGWERDGDEIVREFSFDDYLAGVAFAAEVGEIAEEEFHHPEIRIGYKTVAVSFTSHEAGGITGDDVHMAELVNEVRRE